MNCLIQSGPGETHILDTSVLYIHIKYTNRIQILFDRRFESGKSSKGKGDQNCGTMTKTALQCNQNIAWISGNGQDFKRRGPGPIKYFYSGLWVYSRLVRVWSSLICLPLTISFDTFNSKWLKWNEGEGPQIYTFLWCWNQNTNDEFEHLYSLPSLELILDFSRSAHQRFKTIRMIRHGRAL